MKKRLLITYSVIIIFSLLLTIILSMVITRNENFAQTETKIIELTKIYANNYSVSSNFTEKIDENIRVSVIDATGKVIADSEGIDLESFENHKNREEIVAAENEVPKSVTRYSSTLKKDMMYYALKVNNGDSFVFVRVALPVEGINSFVSEALPAMLIILGVMLFCAVFLGIFLGNKILEPVAMVKASLQGIANGTFVRVLPTSWDSEINTMLSDINDIGVKLQHSLEASQNEKEKLDYIINNVSDGIVVFNNFAEIVLINQNALNIFCLNPKVVGKNVSVLCAEKKIVEALDMCLTNKESQFFEIDINQLTYLCNVRHTDNELAILVLSDITATRNNEKMRSEFFANASHELKTPLTSIKGFNDLVALKSKDASIKKYSSHIDKETARMLTVINDMLNLSKLESGVETNRLEIDLRAVADDVANSLRPLANEKDILLTVCGEGSVFADREHMYELIKNLVENGIRYNNKGGAVEISIVATSKGTTLSVKDNGIGIDVEHHSRIFERFYRVDKSRSRNTGGTGLGLSIVKHICEHYKAQLLIKSKLGVGTEISVVF
ncbi:MAG: ATP-binding protein [Bacilli bacterium]